MAFMGEVIGILGDGTVWCLSCAEEQYGRKVIHRLINGKAEPCGEDGEPLQVILSGQDDINLEEDMVCGNYEECGTVLAEASDVGEYDEEGWGE